MQNDNSKFRSEFRKRLITFSISIIKLCNDIRRDRNYSVIADQLVRSGTSVGANIIEAKAASSKRDYIHFFDIALKSCNETIYWLILAQETLPSLRSKTDPIRQESEEIAKIIGSGILTMKGKREI